MKFELFGVVRGCLVVEPNRSILFYFCLRLIEKVQSGVIP
jgi:hypothetical protein